MLGIIIPNRLMTGHSRNTSRYHRSFLDKLSSTHSNDLRMAIFEKTIMDVCHIPHSGKSTEELYSRTNYNHQQPGYQYRCLARN